MALFFKRPAPAFGMLLTLTLCCSLLSILSLAGRASGSGAIAVPAYAYPCTVGTDGCAWTLFEDGSTIVVINPHNGPSSVPDDVSAYTGLIATLKDSTVKTVLAYVDSNYGNRDPSLVLSDIDAYYVNYTDIDGIFLDRGSISCDTTNLTNYVSYDDRVKTHWGSSGFTASNWGTQGSECYLTGTNIDLYVNFEGDYTKYTTAYPTNPGWISTYGASRFWHIVYAIPAVTSTVQAAVTLSQSQTRQAGYYYFTDALLNPNAYNVSPSQTVWNAELPQVHSFEEESLHFLPLPMDVLKRK